MFLTARSKDFLDYVGMDMQYRWNRLLSLTSIKTTHVTKEALADSGFFYYGQVDAVECYKCGLNLGSWSEGDDPMVEHRKYAPDCPIVTGENPEDPPEEQVQVQPKHPELSRFVERLKTFSSWPSILGNLVYPLAEAGFFYMGSGDETKCFFCGGISDSWMESDDPWKKHADKFPYCEYVRVIKGLQYVVNLKFAKNHNSDVQDSPVVIPVNKKFSDVDKSKCVRCRNNARNYVFDMCGHIAVCKDCIPNNEICPICDMPFTKAVKIYYS